MPYERKTETINSSKEFRDLVSKFNKTSEVAKTLSKIMIPKEHLVDNHVDYISVSESDPTKISYLTKDRINSIIKSGGCLWTSPTRFCCKPGSFVGKLLKNIDSKSVETFSNQYRSFSTKEVFRFEIISGDAIPNSYNELNYASQRGSLGASCMKYERCQSFFDIYSKNKCVSVLVMKNQNDLIIGRSLLWNFIYGVSDYKIMDRIYTVKDEDYAHYFKNWAHDNGYIYKKHQNWTNTLEFEGDVVSKSEIKLQIPLDVSDFKHYPYLDTFKWLDIKGKFLYNYIPDNFHVSQRYRNISLPDGYSADFDYLILDEISKNWIYKQDSALVMTNSGNIRTSINNCAWCETLDMYILSSEASWNEKLQDTIYTDLSRVDPEVIKARIKSIEARYKPSLFDNKWGATPGSRPFRYDDLAIVPMSFAMDIQSGDQIVENDPVDSQSTNW